MKHCTLILTAFFLMGCTDSATAPEEPTPVRSLTKGEARVSQSTSAFGWALFRQIAETHAHDNIVLSPLSVSMALGMTLNGAKGETWMQMRETLKHESAEQAEINAGYRGLIDVLRSMDPRVTTTIANSVWARDGFPVLPTFTDTLRSFFDADTRTLDFRRSDAADIINAWVKSNTGGRIPSIVTPPIPEEMVMYLINAIHFKGLWKHRFDPSMTTDATFIDINGKQSTVKMMSRRMTVNYVETAEFTAADIPFGWDRYRMAVIVPRNNEALRLLERTLDHGEFRSRVLAGMNESEIELQIPRFTMEDERTLNAALSALGMPLAFDPHQADFTRINPDGGLYISGVRHKTWIKVDEEGAEAAAATSVEIGIVSMPPTLRADKPFLFVIHEQNTGAILFIGRVASISG
jgi:serine protease inhibitor